jgi:hypothetical protein
MILVAERFKLDPLVRRMIKKYLFEPEHKTSVVKSSEIQGALSTLLPAPFMVLSIPVWKDLE